MPNAIVMTGYGPPEVLQWAPVALPEPGAGQIRIKVKAAGISPTDLALRAGRDRMGSNAFWRFAKHVMQTDIAFDQLFGRYLQPIGQSMVDEMETAVLVDGKWGYIDRDGCAPNNIECTKTFAQLAQVIRTRSQVVIDEYGVGLTI